MVSCSITHLHYDDGAPWEREQGKTRPVALLQKSPTATGVHGRWLWTRACSRFLLHFLSHGYTALLQFLFLSRKIAAYYNLGLVFWSSTMSQWHCHYRVWRAMELKLNQSAPEMLFSNKTATTVEPGLQAVNWNRCWLCTIWVIILLFPSVSSSKKVWLKCV